MDDQAESQSAVTLAPPLSQDQGRGKGRKVSSGKSGRGGGGSKRGSGSGSSGVQEAEVKRLDQEWEEDLVAFARYKVMRSGYEEQQGNNRLIELRQQAASLVAMGSTIQGAERKLLAECYDKAYQKAALDALLVVKHPHLVGHNLNKMQIIGKLIDAGAGFPTMQDWIQIMDKARALQNGPHTDEPDGNGDSDEEDKDVSKAQRHSQTNTAERSRPLNVVKKGRSVGEGKVPSSSFASSAFPINTNLQQDKGSINTNSSSGSSKDRSAGAISPKSHSAGAFSSIDSKDAKIKAGTVEGKQGQERRELELTRCHQGLKIAARSIHDINRGAVEPIQDTIDSITSTMEEGEINRLKGEDRRASGASADQRQREEEPLNQDRQDLYQDRQDQDRSHQSQDPWAASVRDHHAYPDATTDVGETIMIWENVDRTEGKTTSTAKKSTS